MLEKLMIILGIMIILVAAFVVYLFIIETKNKQKNTSSFETSLATKLDEVPDKVTSDTINNGIDDFDNTVKLNPTPIILKEVKRVEYSEETFTHNKHNMNPAPVKIKESPTDSVETFNSRENSTVDNEIGFSQNAVSKEAMRELLSIINKELNKKANNDGKILVNYLGDNVKTLEFKNGMFELHNEELLINGIVQKRVPMYVIKAGDRITIRFCVNFTLPEGYDLHVTSNLAALRDKGLLLKNITDSKSDATSIRAILSANKDCLIDTDESLFGVRILEEVVL